MLLPRYRAAVTQFDTYRNTYTTIGWTWIWLDSGILTIPEKQRAARLFRPYRSV